MGLRPICTPSTSAKYMLSRYTCQWPDFFHSSDLVGAALALVDLRVRRAVHGLEAHLHALDVREVHVVAVHVPVAGLFPQLRSGRSGARACRSACAPGSSWA